MNSICQEKTIVIDARVVIENQGHGIARHVDELVRYLMAMGTHYRFVLLVNKSSPFLKCELPHNFSTIILRSSWINLIGQFELFFILRKLKFDLFHSPSFIVPILTPFRFAVTLHDLNHVVLAENYSLFHRIYYNFFLARKIKKASAIITVSLFSKEVIASYFKIDTQSIHVIYNGINANFHPISEFPPEQVEHFRLRYELPEKYILSIGNKKPHKNLRRLVEAYCLGNYSIPLVLATEFDHGILDIASRANKRHMIHFVRYIPNDELPLLYGLAKAFAYPSLYEGFGLPPLEAAACGVPVVTSDRSSLPEIMGEGAMYVNPEDLDDIRRGLDRALTDFVQIEHNKRIGLELVKKFSWQTMAKETFDLYKKILEGSSP